MLFTQWKSKVESLMVSILSFMSKCVRPRWSEPSTTNCRECTISRDEMKWLNKLTVHRLSWSKVSAPAFFAINWAFFKAQKVDNRRWKQSKRGNSSGTQVALRDFASHLNPISSAIEFTWTTTNETRSNQNRSLIRAKAPQRNWFLIYHSFKMIGLFSFSSIFERIKIRTFLIRQENM